MFVLRKTHRELRVAHVILQAQYEVLRNEHRQLLGEWNMLVNKVNARGGQAFLEARPQPTQLDPDDIKRLLMLCHPDKHGGKKMAEEMTQKLLAMRGKTRG